MERLDQPKMQSFLWFGNVPDLKLNTTKPTAMEKLGIFESVHPYSQYVEMLSKGSWVPEGQRKLVSSEKYGMAMVIFYFHFFHFGRHFGSHFSQLQIAKAPFPGDRW